MSLTLVSVPIGNYKDISLRAIETLKNAELIICEERRPAQTLLKRIGVAETIDQDFLFELNEHATVNDVRAALDFCRAKKVALISDCGTPGFCDPGSDLVDLCFRENIELDINPGASSLMSLIALSGVRLDEFLFAGFLPAENSARQSKMKELVGYRGNIILMDTPYRLEKLLTELAVDFGGRRAVLGADLTGSGHRIARGKISDLAQKIWGKLPFILLIEKP